MILRNSTARGLGGYPGQKVRAILHPRATLQKSESFRAWQNELQRIVAERDILAVPHLRKTQHHIGMLFGLHLKVFCEAQGIREMSRLGMTLMEMVKAHLPQVGSDAAQFHAVRETLVLIPWMFFTLTLADAGGPRMMEAIRQEIERDVMPKNHQVAVDLLVAVEAAQEKLLVACAGHRPNYISLRGLIGGIKKKFTQNIEQRARQFCDMRLHEDHAAAFLEDVRFFFFDNHLQKIQPLMKPSKKGLLMRDIFSSAIEKFVTLVEGGNPQALCLLAEQIEALTVYPPVLLPEFFGRFWVELLDSLPSRLILGGMDSREVEVIKQFIQRFFLEDEKMPNIYMADMVLKTFGANQFDLAAKMHVYLAVHFLAHRYFPDDAAFANTPRLLDYPAEADAIERLRVWYVMGAANKRDCQRVMASLWEFCLKRSVTATKAQIRQAFCDFFGDPQFDLS